VIERLLAAERLLEDGSPSALVTAGRLYRFVAEADPRNAIARVGLARVAELRGDTALARLEAQRALSIDPDEVAAQRLLERLSDEARSEAPRPVRRGWFGRLLDRLLGRSAGAPPVS
jgi:hypothetical protein